MAGIDSIGSSYTAPPALPSAAVPVLPPNPVAPDSAQESAAAVSAVPAAPTNANENTLAVYNALANESASTVRGVNLNVSA